MSFENVVNSIPSIAPCLKNGLKAMKANSSYITPADARKCDGSVDLDLCCSKREPNANRWDYIIGYNQKAYFIEVHPASGQTKEVIAKCKWLKNWLKTEGTSLTAIHDDKVFHWLSTGKVRIPGSERALAQHGIRVNSLKLI